MAPFGETVAERRAKSWRSVGLSQPDGLLMRLRIFASTPLIGPVMEFPVGTHARDITLEICFLLGRNLPSASVGRERYVNRGDDFFIELAGGFHGGDRGRDHLDLGGRQAVIVVEDADPLERGVLQDRNSGDVPS